jgi:hypothetical protein
MNLFVEGENIKRQHFTRIHSLIKLPNILIKQKFYKKSKRKNKLPSISKRFAQLFCTRDDTKTSFIFYFGSYSFLKHPCISLIPKFSRREQRKRSYRFAVSFRDVTRVCQVNIYCEEAEEMTNFCFSDWDASSSRRRSRKASDQHIICVCK